MRPGKLYGVGIGPGDPRYLTLRAADVLRTADVIFTVISRNASSSISRSVVESQSPRGTIRQLTFSMSRNPHERESQIRTNAEAIMAELREGRDCVFATLGDATTYSTFGYVLKIIRTELPAAPVEIVPGVTSFATLAAKARCVLVENGEELRIIPSFRSEMANTLTFNPGSTTVLLKTYRSRKALLDRLAQERNISILYGEHLSMDDEFFSNNPEEIESRPEDYLSLIMVRKQ